MTERRQRLPFLRRLSTRALLAVSVLLVGIEAAGMRLGFEWGRERIEAISAEQARSVGEAVAYSSVEQVLTRDREPLREALELLIAQQGSFVSGRFLDASGEELIMVEQASRAEGRNSSSQRVAVLLEHSPDDSEVVGWLELGYAPQLASADLWGLLLRALGFAALTVFAMALAIGVLLARQVLSPLARLRRAVLDGEDLEHFEPLCARTDEFGDLARAVVAMRGDLSDQVQLAQAANRAKTEFLTNISHEIRTPMTAILGYGEELAAERLDEQARALAVARLRLNGEHLLELVNGLLDIAKAESGRVSVDSVAVDPRALLESVAAALSGRAQSRGLTLETHAQEDVPERICGDPLRLRQVLINLVGNAIKFTDQGGIEVRARTVALGDERRLRIDVRDTGSGISPADLQRVFQPFEQVDASCSRSQGGTGLGLALARELVEAHGGMLSAESEVGRGSCFTLELPLRALPETENTGACGPRGALQVEGPRSLLPAPRPEPAGGDRAPLEGLEILLVDDGEDNRRLVALYLRRAGATVELAENGRRAVHAAVARPPHAGEYDLILMDMQMPVLDGYLATEELRAGGYRGPIVALTAHAMAEDRERCIEAGCCDVLAKPISAGALVAACLQVLTA